MNRREKTCQLGLGCTTVRDMYRRLSLPLSHFHLPFPAIRISQNVYNDSRVMSYVGMYFMTSNETTA